MKSNNHVKNLPLKPVMIFDGDCGFCKLWINRWQQITEESVDYLPAQDARVSSQFPELSREQMGASVLFIELDGSVYLGAEAVFRALGSNLNWRLPLRCYQRSKIFSSIAEWGYRRVAKNRMLFSSLTRWFLARD